MQDTALNFPSLYEFTKALGKQHCPTLTEALEDENTRKEFDNALMGCYGSPEMTLFEDVLEAIAEFVNGLANFPHPYRGIPDSHNFLGFRTALFLEQTQDQLAVLLPAE
jgi:hypothetical protein